MECHLARPLHEKGETRGRVHPVGFEPVERDKRVFAPLLRFTYHMGEDGNKEVCIKNRQDFAAKAERKAFQMLKETGSAVLKSSLIKGLGREGERRQHVNVRVKHALDMSGNGLRDQVWNLTKGYDPDSVHRCVHRILTSGGSGQGLFSPNRVIIL
jgi:hypothetical protein